MTQFKSNLNQSYLPSTDFESLRLQPTDRVSGIEIAPPDRIASNASAT